MTERLLDTLTREDGTGQTLRAALIAACSVGPVAVAGVLGVPIG